MERCTCTPSVDMVRLPIREDPGKATGTYPLLEGEISNILGIGEAADTVFGSRTNQWC